jgi:hypothetical protein
MKTTRPDRWKSVSGLIHRYSKPLGGSKIQNNTPGLICQMVLTTISAIRISPAWELIHIPDITTQAQLVSERRVLKIHIESESESTIMITLIGNDQGRSIILM